MTDYEWSCETSIDGAPEASAEEWMRAIWEDGPRVLRFVLPLAWKFGLGLQLGSMTDGERILGWHIADADPRRVGVDAESRLMHAENVVSVDAGRLASAR